MKLFWIIGNTSHEALNDPEVAKYIPDISLRKVDFPAPLCPIKATRSPCLIVQVIPRNASITAPERECLSLPPVTERSSAVLRLRVSDEVTGILNQTSLSSITGSVD